MDKIQIVLIIVTTASFLTSLVIGYLYQRNITDVGDRYVQQVAPKGIVFIIIWPTIFLWNLVGLIYILVSFCLPEHKSPVKLQPTLISKTYLIGFALSFATTVGWTFAFDREILGLALALLILAAALAYFTVGVSYKLVYDNSSKLEKESRVVLLLMRLLIQNGLCLFATWLTLATLINLADVIIYDDSFGQPVVPRGNISVMNGSTVTLVILMAIIITWFILENFVWEKYCRYTFTIYPVLILALSGIIDKLRFPPVEYEGNQNLIISSVNLSVALVAFTARIVLSIWRWKRRSQPLVATSIPL